MSDSTTPPNASNEFKKKEGIISRDIIVAIIGAIIGGVVGFMVNVATAKIAEPEATKAAERVHDDSEDQRKATVNQTAKDSVHAEVNTKQLDQIESEMRTNTQEAKRQTQAIEEGLSSLANTLKGQPNLNVASTIEELLTNVNSLSATTNTITQQAENTVDIAKHFRKSSPIPAGVGEVVIARPENSAGYIDGKNGIGVPYYANDTQIEASINGRRKYMSQGDTVRITYEDGKKGWVQLKTISPSRYVFSAFHD